jgi:hypothetical protein
MGDEGIAYEQDDSHSVAASHLVGARQLATSSATIHFTGFVTILSWVIWLAMASAKGIDRRNLG